MNKNCIVNNIDSIKNVKVCTMKIIINTHTNLILMAHDGKNTYLTFNPWHFTW